MRRFKYLSVVLLSSLFFILIINSGCGKGGGTPTPPPAPVAEADLVVTTSPVVGSINAPAPLASGLPLTVTISSTMPTGGVKIEITAKLETAPTNFFTGGTPSTKSSVNTYTITNIPAGGEACICTVTVTSLSKATNIWVGTFRFARK